MAYIAPKSLEESGRVLYILLSATRHAWANISQ